MNTIASASGWRELAPLAVDDAMTRCRLRVALADVDARLPIKVPVVIGETQRFAADAVIQEPGHEERIIALVTRATQEDLERASAIVGRGPEPWRRRDSRQRGAILHAAAIRLARRREDLAALAVRSYRVAWTTADDEIREGIAALFRCAEGAVDCRDGDEAADVVLVEAPCDERLGDAVRLLGTALAEGRGAVLAVPPVMATAGLALLRELRLAGLPRDVLALLPADRATLRS